jgi:hypothetical protein
MAEIDHRLVERASQQRHDGAIFFDLRRLYLALGHFVAAHQIGAEFIAVAARKFGIQIVPSSRLLAFIQFARRKQHVGIRQKFRNQIAEMRWKFPLGFLVSEKSIANLLHIRDVRLFR